MAYQDKEQEDYDIIGVLLIFLIILSSIIGIGILILFYDDITQDENAKAELNQNLTFENNYYKCSNNFKKYKNSGSGSMGKPYEYRYKADLNTKLKDLNIGDNIVYKKPTNKSILVHHKVIAIGNDFVITQGTANPTHDNYKIFKEHLIARECYY